MKRKDFAAFLSAMRRQRRDAADETALESMAVYPRWQPGATYEKDERVRYDGKLYRIMQAHTAQAHQPPSIYTASLYAEVSKPSEGTQDNPVQFTIGMALEYGKYYSENGKTYYCFAESLKDNPYTTSFSLIYYGSLVREVV